jgi:heme-binding NEAT domain protein
VYKLRFSSVSPISAIAPEPQNPVNPGTGTGGGTGGGGVSLPNTIADGKYTMNFMVLKYETDQRSVMQDYVFTPGLLTVQGGKKYFSFKLKQSKEITSFKTDSDGSLSDTSVISRDEANNTRVVQFEVKDLSSRLKGWVKINWPEMNYFHDYDVEITFDKANMTKVSADTVLGGGAGSVIASLKDGEYDLDYTVLQYRNSLESKYNDVVAHPARFVIKGEKKSIVLTINQHKLVDDFKLEEEKTVVNTSGSAATIEKEFKSATIVSKDEAADTRIVSFEAKDLTAPIHAQFNIVVPLTEAELQKHQEDLANASSSDDGYTPMLPKKLEKVDVDLVFHIDALGGKATPQTADQAAADKPTDQPTVPAAGSGFGDLDGHRAKAAVERAVSLGIVNGYEDGSFRPDSEISRAEFTVLVGRTLKLGDSSAKLDFADLDSVPAWSKPYLEQAVGAGIISSYEDHTFRAERKITRSEIAVMIARALKLPLDANDVPTFADAHQIPNWASVQVAASAEKGIITGRDNNLFAPQDRVTRAEAVTMILTLLDHAN